jgi:hypothetical protein
LLSVPTIAFRYLVEIFGKMKGSLIIDIYIGRASLRRRL